MAHNKPFMEYTSQESLINELKNTLHRLFLYTGSENNIDIIEYSTILIDFEHVVTNSNEFTLNKLINEALDLGKALVLLNVNNGKDLSKMIGIGFISKYLIIRPYDKFNVFNVLDLYESDIYDNGESHVVQNTDGSRNFNIENVNHSDSSNSDPKNSFEQLNVKKQARIIENILYSDFNMPQEINTQSTANKLAVLPKNQFKLNYLVLESKWNLLEQQVTNNSVVMEISLIASYNPKYKYLRIRSIGSGFNPTNSSEMQYDSAYDRGYFQSHVQIHMEPDTNKLKILSTEPKSMNKQTEYTTSNEFNVGVDVSKNPTFSPSYVISESITNVVSDFNIYNNEAGVTAHWNFNLAMTENSIWDIFDEEFMKKSKIKPLPVLAKKKLKALTEAGWYAENLLNETIGVKFYWKVDHFHCYVTGNWADYTQHFEHRGRTVGYEDIPVYIDFSAVYD